MLRLIMEHKASMDSEKDYLWQHFVFNAEQRLKAFNFFVIFSVFTNGGIFTAFEKSSHGAVFVLIGGFVGLLSIIFFVIDNRSKELIQLAVPGLKEYEKRFDEHSRLFAMDALGNGRTASYTIAFRILFILQLLFGLGTMLFGIVKW